MPKPATNKIVRFIGTHAKMRPDLSLGVSEWGREVGPTHGRGLALGGTGAMAFLARNGPRQRPPPFAAGMTAPALGLATPCLVGGGLFELLR
jgi:hypothetical protein